MEHQVFSSSLLQEDDGEHITVYQAVVGSFGVLCCGTCIEWKSLLEADVYRKLQTLILSVVLHLIGCIPLSAWFQAAGCRAPNDIRKNMISFWEGFAVDMTSDLMSKIKDSSIRSLLTPLASNVAANWLDSKSSVAGHSEMECGCALASILRVVQVGKTTQSGNR